MCLLRFVGTPRLQPLLFFSVCGFLLLLPPPLLSFLSSFLFSSSTFSSSSFSSAADCRFHLLPLSLSLSLSLSLARARAVSPLYPPFKLVPLHHPSLSPSPSVFLLLDHSSVLVFSLIHVWSIAVSVYLCCPRSFSSILHVPRCDRVLRCAAHLKSSFNSGSFFLHEFPSFFFPPLFFFFSLSSFFSSSFSCFLSLVLCVCLLGVPVRNPICQLTSSLSLSSPPSSSLSLKTFLSSPPPFWSIRSNSPLVMEGFDTMAMPYLASPLSLGNLQNVDYLSSMPGMDLPDQNTNFDSDTFVGFVFP